MKIQYENPPLFADPCSPYSALYKPPTLRDWFAGQALAGWVATLRDTELGEDPRLDKVHQDAVAKWSYGYADAMLAARAKENTQ